MTTSSHLETLADLDLQEAQILEEEKNLQTLKESLDRAELLVQRLVKSLDEFDDRITELDPVIMPIYRNMQSVSIIRQSMRNCFLSIPSLNKDYCRCRGNA